MDENNRPERINFSVKGVPKQWFEEEFKPSAYNDYNDTYALKIIHDHEIAGALGAAIGRIEAKLEMLEDEIKNMKE